MKYVVTPEARCKKVFEWDCLSVLVSQCAHYAENTWQVFHTTEYALNSLNHFRGDHGEADRGHGDCPHQGE